MTDKYRWHSLRENPDDLPNHGERVLFCTAIDSEPFYWTGNFCQWSEDSKDFSNDDYEGYVTRSVYDVEEVIAWRYIEPFNE